jgi:UDP:flavonoid glycosyltransferase YjiC (YdhE family)
MPRRIVITSWGSFGDLYPYIGLGRALRARGHHVVLAVPGFYRDLVEDAGLEMQPVGPDIDINDRALIGRIMDPVRGPETLLRQLIMPALAQTARELEPVIRGADLVVSHPVTFAAPPLAQKLSRPWVSTILAPMSFFSATDFPLLPAAPAFVRLARLGAPFGRAMVRLGHVATRAWPGPVYALRRELGLPRGGHPIYEGQFSPQLTLALFSRVLATPQPDWPPATRVPGFVFYNGAEPLTPELEAFLRDGPSPIVFTLGTSAVLTAGGFYKESAAAAMRLGVRGVLLTGGFPENDPGIRSSQLLVVDRAPHQLLFPRAAAIVHQGGAGTLGQALRSGRPTIVVPHSHDQPDNARRVRLLGVSRTILPRAYRADRVARELQTVLREPGYKANAERIGGVVRSEGGVDEAAVAIEQLR